MQYNLDIIKDISERLFHLGCDYIGMLHQDLRRMGRQEKDVSSI